MDSQRWQQEQGRQEAGRGGSPYVRESKVSSRHPDSSLVAYQDSRTHAARQHWGPSGGETAQSGREREPARTQHSTSPYSASEHYTTTPAAANYSTSHSTQYQVQANPYASQPRTAPQPDPYAYPQPGRAEPSGYAGQTQQYPGYSQTAPADPYRQQPPPPTHGYTTPRYFGYFDDHYLVYR